MAKIIVSTESAELCMDGTKLFSFIFSTDNTVDLTKDKNGQSIGIKYIGAKAFEKIPKFEHVILPCELQQINEFAFDSCVDLISVKFDSTNGTAEINSASELLIQSNAFVDCRNLDSVHIRCNKLTIDDNAFNGCNNLRSLVIDCNEVDFTTNTFSTSPNLIIYKAKNCKVLQNPYNLKFEDFESNAKVISP